MPYQQQLFQAKGVASFVSLGREENNTPPELAHLTQISMQQVHGNSLHHLIKKDLEMLPKNAHSELIIPSVDAVYTSLPQLVIKVKHADCLPILIYGQNRDQDRVIAAIHAGRKGTQQEITAQVCQQLLHEFNLTKIEFWLGACICQKCYQINKRTNEHFNLRTENINQIEKVLRKNPNIKFSISHFNHCPAHENQQFFSYRREGMGVKMNWSGIALV